MQNDTIRVERYIINQKYIEWSFDCNDNDYKKEQAFNRIFASDSSGPVAYFNVSISDYQLIFDKPSM